MDENFNPQRPESESVHAHETTDANPLVLGLFGAGLALLIAAIIPVLGWVYWRFEAAAERSDRSATAAPVPNTFAGPKLQRQPSIALAEFRQDENLRLSRYEWIDETRGIVRIPIDRAITILSQRGLPEPKQVVRPAEQQDPKP